MVDEDESVDLSFGLEGKVTVATGGAAGIAPPFARAFVAKGARVALVDRDIDTARAHARNLGENARAFQCDVADPSSAEKSVRSVLAEFGHVDVLVNCAGVVVVAPAEDLTSQMWDTTLAVNLTGTFPDEPARRPGHARGGRREDHQHRLKGGEHRS
jgi:D-threitol dehydrogenase (NAD+)